MSGLIKLMLIVMGIGTVAASTYFLEQVIRTDRSFQVTAAPDDEEETDAAEEDEGEAHGKQAKAEHAEGGEHGGGEHGEGEGPRKPAEQSAPGAPVVVSLEQTFANVMDGEAHPHSLMLKLNLELFDDGSRVLIDQRDGVLKSTIIETARQQSYEQLNTLGGKAYFKEVLVSRMNEALQKAVVREIHFDTFYMQ